MKKRFVLFSILMLVCLGLAGCQASPINSPTPIPTAAPTEDPVTVALERISQLETQKDFEGALTILADLRSEHPDYAGSHEAELDNRAAELYLGWGDNQRASAHYLAALEKYGQASGLTVTSSLSTQIDQGIGQTNNLLAEDSGEDGKALLDAAMAEACYQEIIPTNPLIGSTIPDGELGRILVCDYTEAYESMPMAPGLDPQLVQSMLAAQAGINWLPDDLVATTPGGVRFTLSRLDTFDTVRTCDYANDQGKTDAIGVMRQQSMVMIWDMQAAEIIAERTFDGANPSYQCPQTKIFNENNFTFGQLVDNEKIIAWVRQVISDYSSNNQ